MSPLKQPGCVVRECAADLARAAGQVRWTCSWEEHGTEPALGGARIGVFKNLTVVALV